MKKINWPVVDSYHIIVYSEKMRNLESEIFSMGMPEESLMEKVGIGISRWLLEREYLLKHGVLVVIGPGHNGGDGAVIARELFLMGVSLKIWCPYPIKKKLTNKHIKYLTSLGVENIKIAPNPHRNDLWIDSILGNNQNRVIEKEIIELFNEKFDEGFGKVLSIDVPTGLCPNVGKPFSSRSIKADYTLSVGLKKIGLIQDSAIPYVGEINNIDIGLSNKKLSEIEEKNFSLTYKDINSIHFSLPERNKSKYQRGKTLVIAGCSKYPGAALLSIKGALASGVGSVKALVPQLLSKSIWQEVPELVLEGELKCSNEGNSLLANSINGVNLSDFDSIVIGPGIGLDILDWEESLEYLLAFEGLLILDADALSRIAKSNLGAEFFLKRAFNTWITPHAGEFKRLFPKIIKNNNFESAVAAARQFNLGILYKGANSVIADNNNSWQIYNTDPCSARAGLGDLLSGFIAGMSALEISAKSDISTASFAKYVLLHSYAASKCEMGSNASTISVELAKIVRQINSGLIVKKKTI